MGQFARQRIRRGIARRRNINDDRIRIARMARDRDEASPHPLICGAGRTQSGCVERCPIGLERVRHRRRELVARAEHPHGPIGRQGVERAVHDGLDTLPAPRLGETRIKGRALRAHHDLHLLGAEGLRQRGRNLEWAQPAIDLKLRIDLDALRRPCEIEARLNARRVRRHRNGSGLDTLIGRNDDRHVEREAAPRLHLGQRDIDMRAIGGGAVELELRRSDILDPLIEERPQIET